MFRTLFCSSSGGTVHTAIGVTPTLLATSQHNTHKNVPIAVLRYLLLVLICVLFIHLVTATVRIFKTFFKKFTEIPEVCWNSEDKDNYWILQNIYFAILYILFFI
jgi:hypothetical protein